MRHIDRVVPEPSGDGRGLLPFLKRWTIPIIGALTPVGLIAVNISVFVVKNLASFRWGISILAFVSGLLLNSWAALNIYRTLQRRRPDNALVSDRNQELVLVGGMLIVIIAAFLTALFCYLGLSSEAQLPNGITFITGIGAVLIPIVLQAIFRRTVRRSPRSTASVGGLPPNVSQGGEPPPLPPSLGGRGGRH